MVAGGASAASNPRRGMRGGVPRQRHRISGSRRNPLSAWSLRIRIVESHSGAADAAHDPCRLHRGLLAALAPPATVRPPLRGARRASARGRASSSQSRRAPDFTRSKKLRGFMRGLAREGAPHNLAPGSAGGSVCVRNSRPRFCSAPRTPGRARGQIVRRAFARPVGVLAASKPPNPDPAQRGCEEIQGGFTASKARGYVVQRAFARPCIRGGCAPPGTDTFRRLSRHRSVIIYVWPCVHTDVMLYSHCPKRNGDRSSRRNRKDARGVQRVAGPSQ